METIDLLPAQKNKKITNLSKTLYQQKVKSLFFTTIII